MSLVEPYDCSSTGLEHYPFTLAVIETPPNRPPVFTTSPVVDAYIDQPYEYDADAIDPDQNEPLSYSIVKGPRGMIINPSTGEIEWTPPPALVLGDTVIGRIGIPGENDEFTFSGTTGQRIYFDPLQFSGDPYQWRFDVYSPSGEKIVNGVSFRWYESQLLTLTESGNYRVVVDTVGDAVGSYGFSILDTSLASLIPFDTVLRGTLGPGTEDDIFRFNGNRGQKLYFDQLSKSANLSWVLYNAKNQAVIWNDTFDDIEFELPADGEYILALRGYSAFNNPVDYSFTVVTPDFTTAPLQIGQTISGVIREKGEQDAYTFAGTAGQLLFFDALGADSGLTTSIYDPSGRLIFSTASYDDRGPDSGLALTTSGTYRVVVDGYGETTGSYKFRLLDQIIAVEVALDTDIIGSFDNDGLGRNVYRFSLTEPRYLFFDGQQGNGTWALYKSNGQGAGWQYLTYNSEFELAAGEYFLVFGGFSGSTPDYKLRIITPDLTTQPMGLGTPISGTISEKGEQDIYTFTGSAGQQLFFDALGADAGLSTYIYDPSGNLIFGSASYYDRGPDSGLVLKTNGTYRVVVDGNDEALGNYRFRLLDAVTATVVQTDTEITGTFDENGTGSTLYQLNLTENKYIYFDGQQGNGALLIYQLNGQGAGWQYINGDREFELAAGQYLLVAQGYGGGELNYKLRLVTPEFTTQSLVLGDVVSGAIREAGEQDTYTFTGSAGQQLFYDALGGDYFITRIYDPSGREIFSTDSRYDRGPDNSGLVLTSTGEYRVVVDGVATGTGNYQFRLLDKSTAEQINLDADVTGIFDATGSFRKLYRFTLTDRRSLLIDGQQGSGELLLYGPNGQFITWQYIGGDRALQLNPGEYLIAVQGAGNQDTAYKFRLSTQQIEAAPPVVGNPITFGSTVSGFISTVAQKDSYAFTGTAGQQIFYDALGSNLLSVSLYDPTGRIIYGADSRYDRGPDSGLTLAMNGVYRLVIEGFTAWYGDVIGNYQFRLLDRADATPVNLDNDIAGILTNNGLSSNAYRFTLSQSRYLFFDSQQSGHGQWLLYGANGQFVNYESLYNDKEFQLTAGDYWFVVQGFGGGDINYKLKITTPEFTSSPIQIGNVVSGSISAKGEQESYTFTGSAGQQLFYDALGGDYFITRVYDPLGREIFSTDSRYDRGPDTGLTLSMSGSYRVVVDGIGEGIGNYQFRFLDRVAATPISLDADFGEVFDNGGLGVSSYRFTLTKDQYLFFDGQQGYGDWILYGPNGRYVNSFYVYADTEFNLAAGDYWLVTRGYGGWGGASNYLRIVTPELITTPMTIGDTITGTISEKGEQDIYTFTGSAGQQLFYDALGGDYLQVRVYDPLGREILNRDSRYDWGPDFGLTLNTSGTYRVVIDGNGQDTGNYQFRFLDRAAATPLSLDADFGGTLDNNGFSVHTYQFSLSENQYIFFDSQQGTGDWLLYGSNGHFVSAQNLYQDRELELTAGDYWLVVRGYGGGNSNYKLRLVTPEFPAKPLTFGETVNGAIAEQGEQDSYVFTGTPGQKLFFDALSSDALTIKIFDPVGQEIFRTDSRSDRGANEGLILSTAGMYRVVVDGEGDATGRYNFRFLDLATAPLVQLNILQTGVLGQASLESHVYRFSATAGQSLYLDTGKGQAGNNWIIYAPNGKRIASGSVQDNYYDDYEFKTAIAGEYFLVIQGGGASNSNYQFRIGAPEQRIASLAFGMPTSGTISDKGEQHTYTFNGTVGQTLFFDALQGSPFLKARLYSPSGTLVGNLNRDISDDWGPLNLLESGLYRFVVDGEGSTTGDYRFIVQDCAQAPALTVGNSITGRLDIGSQTNLYRFTAKVGQRLKFDLEAASWNNAAWVLYDPSGAVVKRPSSSAPDFTATFATSGVYTLAVLGNSNTAIDYRFQVTDISQPAVMNSGLNRTQSGTLNSGEVIDYSFTATAGTLVLFDSQNQGNFWTRARILNPDGTIALGEQSLYYDRGPLLLEQSGTYKVQVLGDTGPYQFTLLELPKSVRSPNTNYLEIGGVDTGTLPPLQSKIYSFDGIVGQQMILNAISGQSVRASLYDPNGNLLFSQDELAWWRDRDPLTLSQSGMYSLVVENISSQPRPFAFQLLDLRSAPEIKYGLPISGSLDNAQQGQVFKLRAKAGQRLYFDSLTPNNSPEYRWKLFDAGNKLVFDAQLNQDAEVSINQTGDYFLYVQGGYTTSRLDYNFKVWRHNPPAETVLTPGVGEISSNSAETQGVFSVKLAVKDSLGATAIQDYKIKVWADPNNSNPVILSIPKTRFSLLDRVYQYQLKSFDPDGDSLTYRLLDAPLGALIDSDSGELLWFPAKDTVPGTTVSFSVEVSDRRGGKAIQSFSVDVFSKLGSIRGAVFDDLNGNGFRDTKLVKGDNPAVVFAIDVSGSTKAPFFGDEGDKSSKTVLQAQVKAALTLIDAIVAQGGGDRVKFGVIPHQSSAYIQDMDPATAGIQVYTTALADRDSNGIADIRQILESYLPDGSNNFTTAMQAIDSLFDALPGDPNLIFMSDGYGSLNPTVATQVVGDIKAKGGNVTAFAMGLYSTLETLRKIDSTAEQLLDFTNLINVFSGFDDRYAIEPFKEGVIVYLDFNNNGVLDADEPSQVTRKSTETSSLGINRHYYAFDDLLPGTYTVRTFVPTGYRLTAPVSGSFTDKITILGEDYVHLSGISQIEPSPNEDPVFITTPPAEVKIKAEETFIYRAKAQDGNADPLTYDLVLAPTGMSVDADTGVVFWAPSQRQVADYLEELRAEQQRLATSGRGEFARKTIEFNVLLRAKDGRGGQALQSIKVQIDSGNSAPVFTSNVANADKLRVNQLFQYQAKAIDNEGDKVTYSLAAGAPSTMQIDPITGVLNWTPSTVGTQMVTIRAIDSKGAETLQKIALVVNPASVTNQAPVITSEPRKVTRLGSAYFYQIQATDADGNVLTYSLDSASISKGMQIKDGILSWTPTAAQAGNHSISIQVSDGKAITTQTYTLLVASEATNRAPVITSAPDLVTNLEQSYSYDLSGTDPDGDAVLWMLEQRPDGMVIDARTGALRWQPTAAQIGEHQIAVRLLDTSGLYFIQEFTLKVTGTNAPPLILSAPMTRAAQNQPYSYTAVASDPENSALTFSLGRRPNGMTIDTQTGKLSWTPTQTGTHTVDVQVTDAQGATTTQTFDIVVGTTAINRAPSITSTPIFLANPQSGYRYEVKASDPDGNLLTYKLLQAPTGMTISTTGVISWDQPLVGVYQVVVGVEDGLTGAAQGFTLTVRPNRAPEIRSVAPTIATPGTAYRYDVQAIDADGDSLNYQLDAASVARGMTIDDRGRIVWTPTANQIGQHLVTISVTDAQGATTQEQVQLNVERDAIAPRVQLMASTNQAEPGSTITLYARATDNQSVSDIALTINGQRVLLGADGRATVKLGAAGTQIVAVASAVDAAGNRGFSEQVTIDSVDFSANFDPVFALNLGDLADGFITSRTEITGSVGGEGFARYELSIAPIDSDQFRTIATGTSAMSNGTLGTLDPSSLQNDAYTLRLTVYGTNGSATYTEETVNVAGELKLGNFRLSFTDLAIPVTGIPISLTRTYDTLTSNQSDDFGYGWRMEFRDMDLRTSVRKRTEEEELIDRYPAFDDRTKVFITLPGGKREAFSFRAKQVTQIDGVPLGMFASYFYEPTFIAEKGSTSKLTIEFNNYIQPDANGGYIGQQGQPFNPADRLFGGVYVLTTKDGTQYRIDAKTGDLLTVKDTNGNTLTYTDDAITSSIGQRVEFVRDAQGRIVSVKDPMQEYIRYEYDANGDLVSVTDREQNVTRMVYDTSYDDPNFVGTDDPGREKRSHFLREIIDPLNRTGARSEYDENGRLKQIVDVNGKAVEMTYDLNSDRQVVKDQLGNETIYVYDDRGNIIQELDATGKLTKRAFDAKNNLLFETFITSETGAAGYTTSYTYDDRGNQLTRTNAMGETDIYSYNSRGQLLTSTNGLGHTTSYTYDGSGNVLSKRDAAGNLTTYTYYANGLNKTIIEGANRDGVQDVTYFEYDRFGNRTLKRDALGNETTYTYDGSGNVLTETYRLTTATGVRTLTATKTYDKSGKVKTLLDAKGGLTTYTYDANGNQTKVVNALGQTTWMVYDDKNQLLETILDDDTPATLTDNPRLKNEFDLLGNKTTIVDEKGRRTIYSYDALKRPTGMVLPDGTPLDQSDNSQVGVTYNTLGWMTKLVKDGITTEFEYDKAGRIIRTWVTQNGQRQETSSTYDKAGRAITKTDALGRTTRYVYDELDRLTETIYSDGKSDRTVYNYAGKEIAKVDRAGRITQYEYDVLDRLTAVEDALDYRMEYGYDEAGNLVRQTDANQQTTRYEYDELNRRTAVIRPMGQRSETIYDAIGRVKETKDFNGAVIKYGYDDENRLTSKQFVNEGNRIETYTTAEDARSRTVIDARGTTIYTYDEQGRMLSKIEPDGKQISYTYDSVTGKVASVTTPSGTTQYRYNGLGQLAKVIAAEGETTYEYNVIGNLKTKRLPNGIVESYTYDSLNRLHILEQRSAMGVIASYTYTYDLVGNKTRVEELGGRTVSYTYDALYRLTKEEIVDPVRGNRTIEYGYDAVGNRLTKKDSAIGETVYRYNPNDWLLDERLNGVTTSYTYDANGNTKTKTTGAESTIYVWDTQNRLTGATLVSNGQTQQLGYEYNVEGMRTKSIVDGVETRYLLDENRQYAQVLEEYDAAGVRSRYIYGAELDLIAQTRGGATSFYLEDGHSGVRQLTNAGGTVTDQYGYDAYGSAIYSTGSTQNAYQYRGEQTDPNLGIQYLRARYYNQSLGRLISVDPYEGDQAVPMSRHRYIYANNNPIAFHDPSGMVAGVAGLGDIGVIGAIQGALAAIRLPGMISAGAIVAGAFISGIKRRFQSPGYLWTGRMISVDNLGVSGKMAFLETTANGYSYGGIWGIVPIAPLSPSVPGFQYSLSNTGVEVFARARSADAQPNEFDLGGIYADASIAIKLPKIGDLFDPVDWGKSPGFIMGWGLGRETQDSITVGYSFSAGFTFGLSIPIGITVDPVPPNLPGG